MKQFLQFAFAGTIGFLVDSGVLLLAHPWLGAYYGRFLSFACAVVTTWLINRSWTFRHQSSGQSLHNEFSRYFLTALAGGAVNITCYSLMVYGFPLPVRALPIAVAVGSLAGMLVNYWLSRAFVFTAAKGESAGDARP